MPTTTSIYQPGTRGHSMWQRRNELRDELGPVEPIPGGHVISAAQKLFRLLAPDADWTLRKLVEGGFEDKPWSDVWTSATAAGPADLEGQMLGSFPGGIVMPIRSSIGGRSRVMELFTPEHLDIIMKTAKRGPIVVPNIPKIREPLILKTPERLIDEISEALGPKVLNASGAYYSRPNIGGIILSGIPGQQHTLPYEGLHHLFDVVMNSPKWAPERVHRITTKLEERLPGITDISEAFRNKAIEAEKVAPLYAEANAPYLLNRSPGYHVEFPHKYGEETLASSLWHGYHGGRGTVPMPWAKRAKRTSKLYEDEFGKFMGPPRKELTRRMNQERNFYHWLYANQNDPVLRAMKEVAEELIPPGAYTYPGHGRPALYGWPDEPVEKILHNRQFGHDYKVMVQPEYGVPLSWLQRKTIKE